MRSRYRSTGPTHLVVDACLERAQFSCELCSIGLGPRRGEDYEVHHRRARRSGGSRLADTNSPVNLLILCCDCHTTVEKERSASYEGGWLVRQNADPATVPVLIGAERWVILTAAGGYREVQP